MNPELPQMPPADAVQSWLGEVVQDRVVVEDRAYVLARPARSDHLVEHPAVRAAFAADGYMPYWAELWPGARMLAKAIVGEPWTPGARALELGCGLGLPGVVALAMGMRVTFSDYDPTALRFAADNARLNGFHDFETLQLDWRQPPRGLKVPVLLAADLVYELRNVGPLVDCVATMLAPGGICLLTDRDRMPAQTVRDAVSDRGLSCKTQVVRAEEPGQGRSKGTLYRIGSPV